MSHAEQRMEEEDRARPEHYRKHRMECIREMALMFGTEAVITFCKLNAWKYRYRRKDSDDDRKADQYIAFMESILNETLMR